MKMEEDYGSLFKCERLPNFCFVYGKLGHDNKHCDANPKGQSNVCQCGEWLKAGGSGKENTRKGRSEERDHRKASVQTLGEKTNVTEGSQSLRNDNAGGLHSLILKVLIRWDKEGKVRWDGSKNSEVKKEQKVGWDENQSNEANKEQIKTNSDIFKELFQMNEDAFSKVGQAEQLNNDICEVQAQ